MYSAIAQTGSMVLSGSDLKLVTDDNTKLNLWDLNIVNNASDDPIVGNAEFIYDGTSVAGMAGNYPMEIQKLTISNPAGVTLSRSISIGGNVNLSSGKLNLNGNTLTLGTATSLGTITGANSSNYIVAYKNGTTIGKLVHRLSGNATYSFPIGDPNKYTPVSVTLNSGTLSNATIEVYTNGSAVTGMNPNMAAKINRSWFVEPTGITNPSYNISFSFGVGDYSGSATETISPCKLSNGVWYKPSNSLLEDGISQGTESATTFGSSSVPPDQTTGTLTWNGLTSFSEFGGAGGTQPLPVELISFTGTCNEELINLEWITASEHNSSHFDIEESRDGFNWQLLGSLQAAGNSNQTLIYQLSDNATNAGNNYYRLIQFDVDGKATGYGPINVACEETVKGYFSSFPNPSGSAFQVIVNNKDLVGTSILNITDSKGSQVYNSTIELKDGINMFVVNEELAPGVYFIRILNGTKSTEIVRHAVK
jgi:hypothetical protein